MEDEKIYHCLIEIRERLARIEQAVSHNDERISIVENRIHASLWTAIVALLSALWGMIKP